MRNQEPDMTCRAGRGTASGIHVVPEPIRSIETPSGSFSIIAIGFIGVCCGIWCSGCCAESIDGRNAIASKYRSMFSLLSAESLEHRTRVGLMRCVSNEEPRLRLYEAVLLERWCGRSWGRVRRWRDEHSPQCS